MELLNEIQEALVNRMKYLSIDDMESAQFAFIKDMKTGELMFDIYIPFFKVRSKDQFERELFLTPEESELKTRENLEVKNM